MELFLPDNYCTRKFLVRGAISGQDGAERPQAGDECAPHLPADAGHQDPHQAGS